MKLRTKLALQFTLMVGLFVFFSSIITYFLFADFRKDTFYKRLENKAQKTASRFIDKDINDALLYKLQSQSTLPEVNDLLYNMQDSLLFTTDINHELIIDKNILNQIKLKQQYRFSQNKFECYGTTYSEDGKTVIAIVGAVDVFGLAKLNYLLSLQLLGFFFSIGIVFLGGWFFAKRALMPIKNVISQVENINASKLSDRITEHRNNDEIDLLIKTFNSLLERLENSFELQRNFIANASHEIRNPLTAVTGQLEVALMKERDAAAYKKVIESTLADSKNINVLFNNLLMMAKTSNMEKSKIFELVHLDELMLEARTDVLNHYPGFNIEIIISDKLENENQLTVNGIAFLLKVAFSNLLENACKFSIEKTVHVEFDIDEYGWLMVAIKNTGIGIMPDDLASVFNPFKRGKNVSGIKGHGIGLALVRNIINIHNAEISVTSKPGVFTVFTLRFMPDKNFNKILIPI